MLRDELYNLDTKESYNFLKSAIAENTVNQREAQSVLNKVRKGIRIHFDVRLYFDNLLEYISKTNSFLMNGRLYSYTEIMDEIEERERVIKQFLFENFEDKSAI